MDYELITIYAVSALVIVLGAVIAVRSVRAARRSGEVVSASEPDYGEECWQGYRRLLEARGRAEACANFVDGDGGVADIMAAIHASLDRYAENPERGLLLLRERDIPALVNMATARRFLTADGWAIPPASAAGFTTKANFLESLAAGSSRQLVAKSQQAEAERYDNSPEVERVCRLLPLLKRLADASTLPDDKMIDEIRSLSPSIHNLLNGRH